MWTPRFACPDCRVAVARDGCAYTCAACGGRFDAADGVFRFGSRALVSAAPFLRQYRAVRQADGHGARTPDAYRALPDVAASDPTATEWRIRRESFTTLGEQLALARGRALRVLDVGAGNAWLSRRLASGGHAPVAVDLNDDAADGLRAGEGSEPPFPLVQAHFDALPFEASQFDVVVMNASLHYSPDPVRTLMEANGMLVSDGALVVMDSPMFNHRVDGEAMVRQQLAQLGVRYGLDAPARAGVGFLTFSGLQQVAERLGRRTRFFASRGPIGWRLGRLRARWRIGRAPAAFGVWVAQ